MLRRAAPANSAEEGAAFWTVGSRNLAAQQMGQFLGQRQPQTDGPLITSPRWIRSIERFEDGPQIFRRNARSVVADLNVHMVRLPRQTNRHNALLRVGDRVFQQVEGSG